MMAEDGHLVVYLMFVVANVSRTFILPVYPCAETQVHVADGTVRCESESYLKFNYVVRIRYSRRGVA